MTDNNKTCPINFLDKLKVYSYEYHQCCKYLTICDTPESLFTKKLYSKLIASSHLLEDFLDFHGAKNNKKWYFYRELTAAVRHLSLTGYIQEHISNRLVFYDLMDIESFEREGAATREILSRTLLRLAPVIVAEAESLDIPVPDTGYSEYDFPSVVTGEMLEFDIDDEKPRQQQKNIVKVTSEFLNIAKDFEQFGIYEKCDKAAIEEMVPGRINEVEIRGFEMLVHNLQSSFDTYIIYGGLRFGDRKLKQLRSYFSIVFHLFELTGKLLHFYERHFYGPKGAQKSIYKEVQQGLSDLINVDALLDRIVNYGLYYAFHFLSDGKRLAQKILNDNIERGRIEVGIPVKLGFHSRPSLLVAKITQHYGGEVNLWVGDDKFDASSVLDIQWAGGKIDKEKIDRVVFEGDVRALRDIEILAGVNYGENTMGKGIPLPKELDYLK
ncbi:MAG: HPr family phosphocarrier protein [Thermodesulfobacteriota bacterium]|nr:HPr family phosphocarrier protein [Thermodesulfobacteriota bacterium]